MTLLYSTSQKSETLLLISSVNSLSDLKTIKSGLIP